MFSSRGRYISSIRKIVHLKKYRYFLSINNRKLIVLFSMMTARKSVRRMRKLK